MWKRLVLIFLENMRREGKGDAGVENGRKDGVVGERRGDYNWIRRGLNCRDICICDPGR